MREPKTHDYRRESLGFGHEIRSFSALGPGRYAVEGVGPDLRAGDRVRFTLKGSEALELVLNVQEIRHKLVPTHGWSAVLEGDDFESLDIHRWTIRCEGCGAEQGFEFAAPSDADGPSLERAATARVQDLGWRAEGGHRCPRCAEGA